MALSEVYVESSQPNRDPYLMVRDPRGQWAHGDSRCEAFRNGKPCSHPEKARKLMSTDTERIPEERGLVSAEPLGLVQHVDLGALVRDHLPDPGKNPDGTHAWVYSFRQEGKQIVGLSADGIQDGVRALAFQGETIRTIWVRLDAQDDDDAYFMACAVRYAVSPVGQEIALDSTVRAKKVSKWNDAAKKSPNKNWYEHGTTKAARNVEEAMLPEALKRQLLRQAIGSPAGPSQAPQITQGVQPNGSQSRDAASRQQAQPRANSDRADAPRGSVGPVSERAPLPGGRAEDVAGGNQGDPVATKERPYAGQPDLMEKLKESVKPPAKTWADVVALGFTIHDIRDSANAWANTLFRAEVEAINGPGSCTPSKLGSALASTGEPPLKDIEAYALDDIVTFLRDKKAPASVPPEEPPVDAEFSEPTQEEIDQIEWKG
jgi:hypothetical protein